MKTVAFTEFRRNASKLLDQVEQGATLHIERHGKVVARLAPAPPAGYIPAWKRPHKPIVTKGKSLARMVLEEREQGL